MFCNAELRAAFLRCYELKTAFTMCCSADSRTRCGLILASCNIILANFASCHPQVCNIRFFFTNFASCHPQVCNIRILIHVIHYSAVHKSVMSVALPYDPHAAPRLSLPEYDCKLYPLDREFFTALFDARYMSHNDMQALATHWYSFL